VIQEAAEVGAYPPETPIDQLPDLQPAYRVLRVLPKTTFTIPASASAGIRIVVLKYVDTEPYQQVVGVVRVYAVPVSNKWNIAFDNVSHTQEQAQTDFAEAVAIGSLNIPTSMPPNLVVASLSSRLSDRIRVSLLAPGSRTIP